MNTIADKLVEMRLLIEGAVTLYEQKPASADDDYSLIGDALYILRDRVSECLKAFQSSGKTAIDR